MNEFRIEKDSLGEVRVPEDAWYGAQTARAVANFPISGRRPDKDFVLAHVRIKLAAARANCQPGWLSEEKRLFGGTSIEMRSATAVYVENHTRPAETVLFWASQPGDNYMSRRDTPNSSLFYPSYVESEISDRLSADFLEDLTADPPVLIVDMGRLEPLSLEPQVRAEQRAGGIGWPFPPKNLGQVFEFIEQNYFLEGRARGRDLPSHRDHETLTAHLLTRG